ncbi:hypothetical protein BC629DRAFT_919838 [Irpex lacteus]|nr:hypothetical protein BC629DRAFT_919838 [Irpex lacteus]
MSCCSPKLWKIAAPLDHNVQPPPPSKKSRTAPPLMSGLRGFIHVDNKVASGAAPHKLPRELSSIYLKRLALDAEQREKITAIYRDQQHFFQKFDVDDEQDQLSASAILAANHIDFDALEALQNKWQTRWSKRDAKGKRNETQRVLYQWCALYNH